ncbi:MAG: hypothetical protein L3J83_06480 [Proteobacteria bacterium]|nr:hypothetical protein [Pseudomonadota bacterium]
MSLFNELKRRNVIRIAAAYLIIGWLLAQISTTLEEALNLPDWFDTLVVTLMLIGFPIALIIAWIYELTPEGVKKEKDIESDDSITSHTGKKLDYVTIVAALAVAGMFAWQQISPADMEPRLRGNDVKSDIEADVVEDDDLADNPSEILANKHSIAVLPFAHRSQNQDDLYFTDGIHDDLLTQLAKIKGMKVTSRTSVMQYRDTNKTIKEIADELNVATILEGGIQRAGKRVRINAQLIDVTTDEHLWAETFDREMTVENLFDIQSEITKYIITAIKGQISQEDESILSNAPTQSVAAYDAYLKAKELLILVNYSYEGLKNVYDYLKLAVELDPDFALAHLMIADVIGNAYWFGFDLVDNHQSVVESSIKKVQAILPEYSPELMVAKGEFSYRFENNYAAALNSFLKAYIQMPSDSELLAKIGFTQRRLGLWDDAVESMLLSQKLDPHNVSSLSDAAETLYMLKQWEGLEKLLTKSLDKFKNNWELNNYSVALPLWKTGDISKYRNLVDNMPATKQVLQYHSEAGILIYERNFSKLIEILNTKEMLSDKSTFVGFKLLSLGLVYKYNGDKEQAESVFNELVQKLTPLLLNQQSSFQKSKVYSALALAHVELGQFNQAYQLITQINEEISTDKDKLMGMNILRVKALILAKIGQRDIALKLIEEIIDKPNGFARWELYLHPGWDFFRDDERFNKLIKPLDFDQSMHANNSKL